MPESLFELSDMPQVHMLAGIQTQENASVQACLRECLSGLINPREYQIGHLH
jgi:hypothetical protein